MIDRSIVRLAAIVVGLGGISSSASAGAMSDLSCFVRKGNASLSPRACAIGSQRDATLGADICIGPTARPRPAATSLPVLAKPTHQNLCLKASSSVPLSHLALQAEP